MHLMAKCKRVPHQFPRRVPEHDLRLVRGNWCGTRWSFESWVLRSDQAAHLLRTLKTQHSKLFSRWSFRLRERNITPYGGGFPWRKARSEQEVARRSA